VENLKIKVNSESESKEAQELFFELDYNWFKKGYMEVKTPETIMSFENGALSTGIRGSINHKEITLPELRDLVVLKRNSIDDATHIDKIGEPWLVSGNNEFYSWADSGWMQESENVVLNYNPKPIEKKEMKEYLVKSQDGKWRLETDLVGDPADEVIEIPEGAIKACLNNSKTINFVNSDDDYMNHVTKGEWVSTHRGMHEKCGHVLVWQRAQHPEELPFIDDEPYSPDYDGSEQDESESLNDQYAEIEKVRQSAWQKQEGGSHYKNLKIQPMQYALENKLDYAQANVVKYVTRHKEKNGKEDLLKAIHNLELMIEFYYGDEK